MPAQGELHCLRAWILSKRTAYETSTSILEGLVPNLAVRPENEPFSVRGVTIHGVGARLGGPRPLCRWLYGGDTYICESTIPQINAVQLTMKRSPANRRVRMKLIHGSGQGAGLATSRWR